jgi:opacity protein-like surface antigen
MVRKMFVMPFLFVLFTASQTWAITGLGIGVRGGVIQGYKCDNLNSLPTGKKDWLQDMPMIGAHLKVGTLRVIQLEASLEYAWKEQNLTLPGSVRAKFSINDLSVNGTVKYMLSLPAIKPYVGAGAGIHRLAYGISNHEFSVYIPEDQSKLGLHVVGGVLLSVPVVPLELMAEARYTRVQTAEASTRYATFLAGLTYKLP